MTSAPLLHEPLPVELMNTVWADRDGVHDALETAELAAGWFAAVAARFDVALAGPADDLDRAWTSSRALRDALRALAADATEDRRRAAVPGPVDLRAVVTVLNAAAALAPRWSVLDVPAPGAAPSRSSRTGSSTVDAAISQIAEEGVELFGSQARVQLRACLAPGCVLYFIKSHPRREWCTPACGNRARVARHYQRHRADPN
jgi:predicted RNA-binding Zn ribbon-like protein